MIFNDRRDAGRQLVAQLMASYAGQGQHVVVLGLPRGGVPVAYEVARALGAPLDVFVVRKLGVPGHEELAMGALASGGVQVINEEVLSYLGLDEEAIDVAARAEAAEIARRERLYRGDRPAPVLADRTVIVVDDGLATGATMRAAVAALRRLGPARIVVAVPVGTAATVAELGQEADEVVCLATPEPFWAVGTWYHDFTQTSDAEVRQLLAAGHPGVEDVHPEA
ncbi:MAG TPA: phosphoribosyltransferase [Polyangia bacterium]|jgi:predicted phosphoribosyltransferase|nr:phosphoribosyltransferase [Polyangia bacterium]